MIIGLKAPMGGGKDTITAKLLEMINGLVPERFAGDLYAMANALDPVIRPTMEQLAKTEHLLGDPDLPSRRTFLQHLGTEFGRNLIHPDLWAKAAIRRAKEAESSGFNVILPDARFDNEMAAIRQAGGIVIELVPDWTTYSEQHESEMRPDPALVNYVVPLVDGEVEEGVEAVATIILTEMKCRDDG